MINLVLQRLESLQSELARLDPARQIDATAEVAAMVRALRDVAAEARPRQRKPGYPPKDLRVRAAAG